METRELSDLVVITGATGSIGRALAPALARTHRLRLLVPESDAAVTADDLDAPGAEVRTFDLLDRTSVAAGFRGARRVVHLAGNSNAHARWPDLVGPNIEGAVTVFEVAEAEGVRGVTFASSNWATGAADRDKDWPLYPDSPVRPGNLYGVTKAFGEALGRYFADYTDLRVICLRIGWFLERPFNEMSLRMWLSRRDLCDLIERCIRSEVKFGIYYAASANARYTWDLANAQEDLGYRPVDNSEVFR